MLMTVSTVSAITPTATAAYVVVTSIAVVDIGGSGGRGDDAK